MIATRHSSEQWANSPTYRVIRVDTSSGRTARLRRTFRIKLVCVCVCVFVCSESPWYLCVCVCVDRCCVCFNSMCVFLPVPVRSVSPCAMGTSRSPALASGRASTPVQMVHTIQGKWEGQPTVKQGANRQRSVDVTYAHFLLNVTYARLPGRGPGRDTGSARRRPNSTREGREGTGMNMCTGTPGIRTYKHMLHGGDGSVGKARV